MNLNKHTLPCLFAVVFAIRTVHSAEEKPLGYGTNFGTDLGDTEERDNVIGLGAPAGFIGGESEDAVMDVYHRYQLYQDLVGEDVNPGYADKTCEGGCPEGTHCSYGLCFCETDIALGSLEVGSGSESPSKEPEISQGSHQLEGACILKKDNRTISPKLTLGGLKSCNQSSECWNDDINFECSDESQCSCREGMKYNKDNSECNIYLDVDCSSFSHNSATAPKLLTLVADILAGNTSTENTEIPDSLLAYLDPLTSGLYTQEEILEAYCRDVYNFASEFAAVARPFGIERVVEDVVTISAVVLGVVVVVVLLVLGCICLAGCICWCCFDSCKRKVENFFSPNSYSQGIDNKGGVAAQESSEEKDDFEKVISGYQPVPQQPPPSYPQGTSSLPRGASLPRNGNSLPRNATNSLKRGVSPIPRAYPQLAQAPPGYPESPQKTGPAPPGYPQSPPEYPQTPTPPGYPANSKKETNVSLYPKIPEK